MRSRTLIGIGILFVCFGVMVVPTLAQTTAPDPICPAGYSLQTTFTGDLVANETESQNFNLAQTSNVALDVASGVGHPEAGCQAGTSGEAFPCDQGQQVEAYSVVVNGTTVFTTTDNAEDQWLDFGPQSAGQLAAGQQSISFRHVIQDNSNVTLESVFYSVGVCVQPVQTPPEGTEGCTPGYWKNHTESWSGTGYSAGQTVGSVFSGASAFPSLASQSLLDALQGGGGPGTLGAAEILLRAAVAALLNAAHADVDYPSTAAAIIADVNTALASNNRDTMLALASALDSQNNLGCPLN